MSPVPSVQCNKNNPFAAVAAGLSVFLLMCPSASAQSLTGMGDLPGGIPFSEAFAVSEDGTTVVGVSDSANGTEAFRWTLGTGIVGLGDLPGNVVLSESWGVSADGSVVVGYGSPATAPNEAFRWTQATAMTGLGNLPGGPFSSFALSVSSDGSVVVGYSETGAGNEAFLWTPGNGMIGIGDLPGGSFHSEAWGVSGDGLVIVGTSASTNGSEAFRWINGTSMVGLGDLPGGFFSSSANAVSLDGEVVVGRSDSTPGQQAFRWTLGEGMIGLGDLPGGDFSSEAYAVSSDGSVIAGKSEKEFASHAFIWNESAGMRELYDVLNELGIDVSGWNRLDFVRGVSADGRIFVGRGQRPAFLEAYLADCHNLNLHWIGDNGSWDNINNWSGRFFFPGDTDHVLLTPASGLTITGPIKSVMINGLTIGSSTLFNGITSLELQPTGNLTVNGTTTIGNSGRLAGTGTFRPLGVLQNSGEIDLGNGDLQITGGTIENNGLIRGDGQIDRLENETFGVVRIEEAERLYVTDVNDHRNIGEISLLGGTLETNGTFSNEVGGFISGRGTIHVIGDFFNGGVFAFAGGTTDLFGDLEIYPSGTVVTSGQSTTVFYDDVLHDGAEIRTSAGSSTVLFGACTGSGSFTGPGDVFMEGDLRPGNSPAAIAFEGNLHLGAFAATEIEIGGQAAGTEHDQLNINGDLFLGGALNVALINGYELGPDQQFMVISVDGMANGYFTGLPEGSFVGNFSGTDLFITYAGNDGNDVVLFTAGEVLLGDVNLDGSVNLLDVDPFISRLSTGTFQAEADVNQDGVVNLLDVDPFILVLSGG